MRGTIFTLFEAQNLTTFCNTLLHSYNFENCWIDKQNSPKMLLNMIKDDLFRDHRDFFPNIDTFLRCITIIIRYLLSLLSSTLIFECRRARFIFNFTLQHLMIIVFYFQHTFQCFKNYLIKKKKNYKKYQSTKTKLRCADYI